MSALPPKADFRFCNRHVRFVPKADIFIASIIASVLWQNMPVRFTATVGLGMTGINARTRGYVLAACVVQDQQYPNSHLSKQLDLIRLFGLANIATY